MGYLKRHAHIDCFAGISGDMTLGALLDLGVDSEWLVDKLGQIPLAGFRIEVERISKHGIASNRVRVEPEAGGTSRDYAAIRAMIVNSPFSDTVRSLAEDIFARIATAEAGIHGCPIERVHFHEVGGVDAIVDIVGTALLVEKLDIGSFSAARIPLGSGFVQCRHGTIPVPSPATLAILKEAPVYGTDSGYEMVTPTGAAIVTALTDRFGPIPAMKIEAIGYGAGARDVTDRPNLLRIVLGKPEEDPVAGETIDVVEANIDDMNPEIFGFVMERLFGAGALDVSWVPVFMKKNRPGTLVRVLCPPDCRQAVVDCLLGETTAIGARYHSVQRQTLARSQAKVTTALGDVQVKIVTGPDGVERKTPEYESCRQIALEKQIPLKDVYAALAEILGQRPGRLPEDNS